MDFTVLLSIYYKESIKNLEETFYSLQKQTKAPSEIILVKDGILTKDLDAYISQLVISFPQLKIVQLPTNLGLGKALNEGLKYCTNEVIARMDTDDIAKCQRFEKQIEFLKNNPDIDVVGTWTDEFIGSVENIISQRKPPVTHKDILAYSKHRNPINHPTVMFRKQAVLNAGGYQHFPLFEDYYLWIRMLSNGSKFHNIPESLLYFRTSIDVYKRRGGIKYAITEFQLRKTMYEMDFISLFDLIVYSLPRFFVRIIPSVLRKSIYKKFLR